MAVVAAAGFTACRTSKTATVSVSPPPSLATATDSVCYAIGVSYGTGLRENMKEFPGGAANSEALADAFLRAFKGDSVMMTQNEAQAYIQSYFAGIQQREAKEAEEKEARFLEENKTREGVTVTESGLQYKILTQGDGLKPAIEAQVRVHYTGKLLDGKVFDSSVERGEPVVFGLAQVIPGWTEVLQLMPVGSKYQVWIPAALAYGQQGAGNVIKPNSTLEFEIELLEILPPGTEINPNEGGTDSHDHDHDHDHSHDHGHQH
jgi:FKBP-type peptidyl-prolyl cis-trans isomerase